MIPEIEALGVAAADVAPPGTAAGGDAARPPFARRGLPLLGRWPAFTAGLAVVLRFALAALFAPLPRPYNPTIRDSPATLPGPRASWVGKYPIPKSISRV